MRLRAHPIIQLECEIYVSLMEAAEKSVSQIFACSGVLDNRKAGEWTSGTREDGTNGVSKH